MHMQYTCIHACTGIVMFCWSRFSGAAQAVVPAYKCCTDCALDHHLQHAAHSQDTSSHAVHVAATYCIGKQGFRVEGSGPTLSNPLAICVCVVMWGGSSFGLHTPKVT
jgi:hypothetical protein